MAILPDCDFHLLLTKQTPSSLLVFHAQLLLNTKETISNFYAYAASNNVNSATAISTMLSHPGMTLSSSVMSVHEKFIVTFLVEQFPATVCEKLHFIEDYAKYPIYKELWNTIAQSCLQSKNYEGLYDCLEVIENVYPTWSEIYLRQHFVLPSLTKDFFMSKDIPWIKHNPSTLLTNTVYERFTALRNYISNSDPEYVSFLKKFLTNFDYGSNPAWIDIIPPTNEDVLNWATSTISHQRLLYWDILDRAYPGLRLLYELKPPEDKDGVAFGKALHELISYLESSSPSAIHLDDVNNNSIAI